MQIKGPLERWSWIAGISSALIAAVALGYSFWPSANEQSPAHQAKTPSVSVTGNGNGSQIGSVAGNVTIYSGIRAGDTQASPKLPLVFKAGIIGSNVDWFEGQVGPPVSQIEEIGLREYKIDDCKVDLKVRKDKTIDEVTLYVSPICTFNWRDINPSYADLPPPNKLHFSDVIKSEISWTFYASCITDCGNSTAPVAELRTGGSHADDWLIIAFGAVEIEGENVTAMEALEARIENEKGKDFAINGYQCGYDLNGAAKGNVEGMRVNYITIRSMNTGSEAFPGENERCENLSP